MIDIHTRLATLKRPPLLARAARYGVDDYRREVHLDRILQANKMPRPAEAIMRLFDIEAEMNTEREQRSGDYKPARHVEVLIALIGEARLMQATALRAM